MQGVSVSSRCIGFMRLTTSAEDGLARIGATLFGELLNAVFANVGQRAVRKVARETFERIPMYCGGQNKKKYTFIIKMKILTEIFH